MDTDKMYEMLQGIKQSVAVIESKLINFESKVGKIDDIDRKLIEHEESIKQLKATNTKLWGVVSGLLIAVASALLRLFIQ